MENVQNVMYEQITYGILIRSNCWLYMDWIKYELQSHNMRV